MEDIENTSNPINIVAGTTIIFSLLSILFIFISFLIVGSLNNYAINDLLTLSEQFETDGLISAQFQTDILMFAESYIQIIDYLDTVWLIALIGMIAGLFIYSYFSNKQSYFTLFTYITLGFFIIFFVAGIFLNVIDWFKEQVLFAMFPTISTNLPYFTFYLDNLGLINLIIITVCIILNHLDFKELISKKQEEPRASIGEI